ncbi:cell wall glucanosyltransferase Mwg1 [Purpureocillium lilacinum]|uniref:Cell wall glucanosyltransferase Mwg1 n=1 Tax=Purpureocillium lilacinum TaxID=33203 RepID=A0A179H4B1_PURLI|nr:cell wall glucanosyltransferase Mwg1 [Purpureocillium lilacinum]OAQ85045.1 cell wall glucanosyltransferase Mwg1 [Purpureocillium lilacinum]OAQ89591.1 cell wall glucanosyltransferase Mwg1 [Purpureocillium lilacinum]
MFTKSIALALAAAALSLVSAQTWTDCDPTKQSCPPDPAFGKYPLEHDFAWGPSPAISVFNGADQITYSEKGAVFNISAPYQSPTLQSKDYVFFGEIDVVVQAAPGRGIVTAITLQSDDLDEVDFEFVGSDTSYVQSAYFSRGRTDGSGRGGSHDVSNPMSAFHKYSFRWNSKGLKWLIDDKEVRYLDYERAKASGPSLYMPQTPMRLKIGTWAAGGPGTTDGVANWAGGRTDFKKGPFVAYYRAIRIVDYAGGDGPGKDARQYVYGDQSGTWQSIKVIQ